jgi:hypothetical protein
LDNIDNKYKNIFRMNDTKDDESLKVIGLTELKYDTGRVSEPDNPESANTRESQV